MEWISVDDRLPGIKQPVLMSVKILEPRHNAGNSRVDYGCLAKDASNTHDIWVQMYGWELSDTVTHWMPLPEPVK